MKNKFIKLLCPKCHSNEKIINQLRIDVQKEYEKNHTREDFIKIIRKKLHQGIRTHKLILLIIRKEKNMAGEKESFVFYKSFFEALQDLKEKDRLKVYDAICNLALNDEESKLTGLPKTIFTLIKPQILANQKRYENGKKRW